MKIKLSLLKCRNYRVVWLMEFLEEVVKNITVIAEEWIETAKELGREIPVSKGKLYYA